MKVFVCLIGIVGLTSNLSAEPLLKGGGPAVVRVQLSDTYEGLAQRLGAKLVKYPHVLKDRQLEMVSFGDQVPFERPKRQLFVKRGKRWTVRVGDPKGLTSAVRLSLALRCPLDRTPIAEVTNAAVTLETPANASREKLAQGVLSFLTDRTDSRRARFWERSLEQAQKRGWYIAVDKTDYNLYLFRNGVLMARRDVATGICGCSPEGQFTITEKDQNIRNHGKLVEQRLNDELGDFWLGLNVNHHITGVPFGIHGTNQPESIGSESSRGCIRLRNEEFLYFYNLIPVGTVVDIVGGA